MSQIVSTENKVGSVTQTTVVSAATSGLLLAANSTRKGVHIVNTDANLLHINYGSAAVIATANVGSVAATTGLWIMPEPIYTGALYGIWAGDGAGVAIITEL
jgi:hypothetical protein